MNPRHSAFGSGTPAPTRPDRAHKLIVLCALALALPASAEVTESFRYTHYLANAIASESLEKTLNDASPHREGSEVFLGITDWNVGWQLDVWQNPDGHCKVTKVDTRLSVSIDLPMLNGGSPGQVSQFEKIYAGLRVHELGHYAIAQQAAAAVDAKIRSLPEMPSCDSLTSAANEAGVRILDEYRRKDVQYDATTHHGKTQEAWSGS